MNFLVNFSGIKRDVIAAFLLAAAAPVWAIDSFTIRDIQTEGLQRLEIGTVLSYLPLNRGDELNDLTSRQAIRALYASGLFQDVQLLRDGNSLLIKVIERPAINKFSIDGNEKVGGDDLKKALASVGLVDGEVFKRATLDQVQQELRRQYYAEGYYDVDIQATVTDLPNNRVDIKVKVVEGKPTKIKDINIIGNTVFSTEELLKQIKLEPTNWIPFQKTDRYSKQTLGGDLESLQSYYQDRGYLQFNIRSVQVALSPDKRDIYLTINVQEGQKFTVDGFKMTGDLVVGEDLLGRLVSTKAGTTFSRKEATESATRVEAFLADQGFAFAKVTPLPEPPSDNKDKQRVTVNYLVDPGKRAYVRRITFQGHGKTNDETLRREMRQLEAAPFSKTAIERSRVRLARLPFVEEAEVETKPVGGTEDLVDVVFKIKERAPGSVQFGVGFSQSGGFLINANLTHTNFLGTGNRVSVVAERNAVSEVLDLSWTDPYFTEDGVSQTLSAYYRATDQANRFASTFNTNSVGLDATYAFPISEFTSIRAGIGAERLAASTSPAFSSDQQIQFVQDNGAVYNNVTFRTGIVRDTRNRTFFATRGSLNRLNLDATLPLSTLKFYTLSFNNQTYLPLPYQFVGEINANASLVESYGDTIGVPPYERFFGGGPRSVRGLTEGTLGPRDTPFDRAFGGRMRTTMQANLILPLPFESNGKSTRTALFYDVGNVFESVDQFKTDELRHSVGLGVQWFTPFLGLIDLSYAFPLSRKPNDQITHFQITFGSGF
jgi:outer membrane protein insertion porin family